MPAASGSESAAAGRSRIAWQEIFEHYNPKQWREVTVTRHTSFRVMLLDGRRCLEALSHNSASIFLSKVNVDPAVAPWMAWDWRVDRFVDEEDLYRKEKSDASARVYVYFDTPGLPWQKHSIDYVWSSNLPVDTLLDSPFSASSKIIVASSGVEKKGQWQQVRRNIPEDYQRCFSSKAPKIAAIGLMTDTDSAGGHALAYYDDVQLLTTQAEP